MTASPTVLFRVDASVDIGSGHVMRCLALAAALAQRSARCVFVCRDLPGNLAARIEQQGFSVAQLALPDTYVAPADDSDYAGWLQVSELQDAQDFCAAADTAPDIVVVDHYALGQAWESAVYERWGHSTTVLALDDLCRVHAVDLILDQTLARVPDAYAASLAQRPGAEVMAGVEFALLRDEFVQLHENAVRDVAPDRHRVLVTMGGYDKQNMTTRILACLEAEQGDWIGAITVVLPESAPHFGAVREWVAASSLPVTVLGFVSHIGELMADATLCIGAPGSTSWERAAVGLPSVLIPLADNQRHAAGVLADSGVAIIVSDDDLEQQLSPALRQVRDNWARLAHNALSLIDGKGAGRVAERLLARTGSH